MTRKPDTFASRLTSARVAAGFTSSELATRAGISRQLLHKIESGTVEPRSSVLRRLADAFTISIDSLVPPA